ncbi:MULTISPECIES: PH domain-containing protein [Hyphomicrobiales]|uniref:PH domain-containing protein n=2 Tax=Hyphomicrobiales TaxID=356 RepID=UPI002119FBC0|nr:MULTISPECIES: PH domain-containing protein [Hyphomicrobiales]MCQ9147343.1 PH domain-containing protein [Ochrobactrum sp. BTU2]MDH1270339.1 PH domain-containing protein [Agrobacterium pusense]
MSENPKEPISRYRLSLIIFVKPILTALIGFGLLVWIWIGQKDTLYRLMIDVGGPNFTNWYAAFYPKLIFYGRIATSLFSVFLFLVLFQRLIVYLSTELRVFDDAVLWRTGFIQRNVFTIAMPEVIGANFKQSVLGRLLGYGSIMISSRGDDQIAAHMISGAPAASAEIMALKAKA